MLEKLISEGSYIAAAISAVVVISVAFFRYVVPALLAAFFVSKGRKASIRSTKQGIEILTQDEPGNPLI